MIKGAGRARKFMNFSLRSAQHLTLSFVATSPSFQFHSLLACKLLTVFLMCRPFQHLLRTSIARLIDLKALPDHPDTAYTSEPFEGMGPSLHAPRG